MISKSFRAFKNLSYVSFNSFGRKAKPFEKYEKIEKETAEEMEEDIVKKKKRITYKTNYRLTRPKYFMEPSLMNI